MRAFPDFNSAITTTKDQMRDWAVEVDPGHWQGVDTEGHPDLKTKELYDVLFSVRCPHTVDELRQNIMPNLPWADLEFEERVGGRPHNPHHSLQHWPWWQEQTEATMYHGMFSHTYSERFWPKYAGNMSGYKRAHPKKGLRYTYGDLSNVIDLLLANPHTRQAYLPIFFPEDTGAVHGGRIPCTLGYHFLLRNNRLHMWYFIRSCDLVRHFRDDLYLAARLQLWVLKELAVQFHKWKMCDPKTMNRENVWAQASPGTFHFHCMSLHYNLGDAHLVEQS